MAENIEKDQVVRTFRLLQCTEPFALNNGEMVAIAGVRDIGARQRDTLWVALDRRQATAVWCNRPQQPDSGIPGGHADFQRLARACIFASR